MGVGNSNDATGSLASLLDEGEREERSSVLTRNITAGKMVGGLVAPTLGPMGRDVLLYPKDEHDEGQSDYFEVTNSGAYVLKKVDFEAPAAQVVSRIAKAQDDRCGDGTTTTAVYASQILHHVEPLLEDGLHPTTIISGVTEALVLAEAAVDACARGASAADRETVEALLRTALSGRQADAIADDLCEWILSTALSGGAEATFDPNRIRTESLRSGTLGRTEFVDGMVLKKSFAGNYRPTRIESPRIAVVTQGIARAQRLRHRIERDEVDDRQEVTYDAADADAVREFQEYEMEQLREHVRPLVEAGVDVLFAANRVEDAILSEFESRDVAVVREADVDRLRTLASATGATVNKYLDAFAPADVGRADRLETRSYDDIEQNVIFVHGGADETVASVLVHGSTWSGSWEVERNVNNAVAAVRTALDHGSVVSGGGAVEMEISRHLRNRAPAHGGRESLVVEAVADAVEEVPRLLARSAGMRPTDAIVKLRTRHHGGDVDACVLPTERTVGNASERGVVEPAANKRNALEAAGSVVSTILRIDDVVAGIDRTI